MDGSSVLERFEGPASLTVPLSIKVSSSNKQPKASNPLAFDAVTVTHNNTQFGLQYLHFISKPSQLYTIYAEREL